MFIMDLGRLQVNTKPRGSYNIQEMHSKGLGEQDIMQRMFEQSYDVFMMQITDMQVSFFIEIIGNTKLLNKLNWCFKFCS